MKSLSIVLLMVSIAQAKDPQTTIMAISANGENLRTVIELDEFPYLGSPDVSPDGQRLTFDGWRAGESSGDSQLFIVDLNTQQVQHLGPGAMPTWSADGKFLAYSGYSPRGVHIRSADGVASKLIDKSGWGIQWSPDGQKLSYTMGGNFVIYDILQNEKRTINPNPASPYLSIYWNSDWSPDSQKICFKGRRKDGGYDAAIIDISTPEPKLTICFDASKGFQNEFSWHPDGDRIAIVKTGKPNRLVEFQPVENASLKEIPGQPEDRATFGACWSSDGKTLYFLSR